MAHAIEVSLSANVEKYNQGMAAAKKTGSDSVGFIASIFATVTAYFGKMWDSAKSFFSGVSEKGGSAWSSFGSSASGAFDKIRAMLPGVSSATKDAGDEMKGAEKKTDSWLSKLGTALLGVAAIAVAVAAAIASLAAKGMMVNAAFAKISIATNVGAGELSKFEDTAKRSGMTVEQLGTSVSKFQDAMKEAAAGTGAGVFKELGVDVKDGNDQLLATGPTLVDFAKHVAAMSSEAEKYGAAAKSGFSVQFLEDLARAGALAAGTTNDQAEKVERLGKIFHEILPSGKTMWQDISTTLSNKLTPALTTAAVAVLENKNKILSAFEQIYGGGSMFDKLGNKIGEWGNDLAGYFSKVVTGAANAGIKLMEFIGKATGLGKAMTAPPSVGDIPKQTPLASGKPVVVPTQVDVDAGKKYDEWTKSVKGLVEAQELEKQSGAALTQGQRMQLALTDGLRDGTIKETGAQVASRQALVDKVLANEKQIASSRQAQTDADALAKKQAQNYASITASIQSKIAQDELELLTGNAVTEGQKLAIKIQKDLEASKKTLTAAQIADTQAQLAALSVVEKRMLQDKAQKEVTNYIEEGTIARSASRNALEAEYQAYGKNSDALALLMVAVNAQTEEQKVLDKMRKEGLPVSDETIKRLEKETADRTKAGQATMSQSQALAYANQLADENKRFGAENLFDEKDRAAALLAIDAKMWQERIQQAGAGTEAQKVLQEQYDIWYSNQSLKPQLDEQKKVWTSIESTAHDTFVSIFVSGKSAFDRLRDTLKNGLLDLLYQMVIKKWVLNIGASVGLTGASGLAQAATGTGGIAGAASGATGLVGMAQTAATMYKAISGGFSALSGTVADAVQVGMYETGMTSELLVNGAIAKGAGAFAGVAAGVLGGVMGGRLISGQFGSNSTVNVGTAVGAAVGSVVPVIGTAIGALVGGLLGGIGNRLFGMGDKKVSASGITGTLSDAGLTGNDYAKWTQKGGWFRSDKSGTDKSALDPAVTAQFVQGFATIKAASAGFAASVGASTDSLAGYSKTFDIALTSDKAANEKAITDFFTTVGDEVALRLVPGLAQFNKSGETMATTLQRLAGDFDATNQVAMLLGKNGTTMFGSLGIDSAAARERLIDLSGGVQNLSTQATAFAQNYLSEAERLKPVSEAVAAAMASLGLAGVTTREQFKTVVQGLDVTTAAGAQQFASMMALSDAFAQVHPAIEATTTSLRTAADVLSEQKDLQGQIDKLTLTSTQLRAKERMSIDASNLALFDTITNLQAAADVSSTLKTSIDSLKAFRASILSFSDSQMLGSLSPLTALQKDAEAKRQYEAMLAKANTGDETARAGIQAAATAFLTADQIVNASSSAYVANFTKVQSDLASLAAVAGSQMSDAQQQLAALDQQVSQLAALNATANGIETALATSNWGAVGTTDMSPLADEIKGLRSDNADLRADNAKLVEAINNQTAAVVQATLTAAANNAETVTTGAAKVATSQTWAQNLVAEANK